MMDTPALRQLMGAYFHQDWFEEHGDPWATLEDFVHGERALVPSLRPEIDETLRRFDNEEDLAGFLRSLGCSYTAPPGTGGYRAWLEEIARRVRTATAQS